MKTPEQRRLYQAVLERHGKYLLLFIIGTIVLIETRSLLGTLSGRQSGFQLIAAIAFSVFMIRSAIATWFGNQGKKHDRSISPVEDEPFCFGFDRSAAAVGPRILAPENAKVLLFSLLMLAPALVLIVFYGGLAVLMKYSPSVDAFSKSVLRNGVPPRRWPEWLRGIVGVPTISDRMGFMRRSENPVYTRLTQELVNVMDDDELDGAVLDYVNDRCNQTDNQSTTEVLKSLPVGYQDYYSLWWMQAEIDNGGLFQFFVNKGQEIAFMALEASRRVNRPDVTALLIDAINAYLKDETSIKRIQSNLRWNTLPSNWADDYIAADHELIELSDLSSKYSQLPLIDLPGYLRNNLALFQQ